MSIVRRKRINRYKNRSEIVFLENKIKNESDERKKEILIEEKKNLESSDVRESSNYGY